MIKQIEEGSALAEYEKTDIYSVRILSLLSAYGCKYSFARFYMQTDESGKITAILSSLDGNMTVSFTDAADKNEISDFSAAIGFATLLCDESLELDSAFESGEVMKSFKKMEVPCAFSQLDEYPDLFELYNFIDYGETDFASWYVDINHRIRHNAAKAFSLKNGDGIISTAVLSSIYKNSAVLTGVRTKPEYRRGGYASALVSAVCCGFCGDIYLMRESGKNERFYKKLGFENIGRWRMYK